MSENDKDKRRERIVRRIVRELPDQSLVNLGIGLPTLVANHLPEGKTILLHSENGFIGLGPEPPKGREDLRLVNAGGVPVSIVPGGASSIPPCLLPSCGEGTWM